MNGRIVELDASLHQRVEKLLPWLLVDALPDAELALVREHLQVCKPCRDDLAWQRKIQGVDLPGMSGADAERAFAALRPRLDGALQAPAPRQRRLAWLGALIHGNGGGWLGWALAAQGAAIAALAVALLMPSAGPAPGPAPGAAQYHALGAPPLARGNVVLMFQPATPEQELRRILRSSGARIVDGPTVTGVYLLELPDAQRAAGIAALRRERAVVLAQSLDPGGRR